MAQHIEIGTPAILPMAFANLAGSPVLLGMTLQHPPVHLRAGKSKQFKFQGPRAHVARRYAERFLLNSGFSNKAEIIIENTPPSLVGFGSDEMLALSVAQAMAWVNDQDIEDYSSLAKWVGLGQDAALAFWSFCQGGILLVEMSATGDQMPPLLRRVQKKHRDNKAWSVNFHFPNALAGAPDNLEQIQRANLNAAAAALSPDSGILLDEALWPALEADDIAAFCSALTKLMALNDAALKKTGHWPATNDSLAALKAQLDEHKDVLATGISLTGHSIYALAESALASQSIRVTMRKAVGSFGGQVEATINDIDGNRPKIKDEDLHLHTYKLPNLVDGITGEGRK